ncbi:K02A2.6-like [Cordylochernes scorpioides]|uniref:RNA-directed DNA polymerase n=1 Tax=Cordylochernes scorpioides TaxID=51811 RepID=A0ABY6K5D1_9ARAC|nr:K02A2.6-like [Cordylochernes scorpioides]
MAENAIRPPKQIGLNELNKEGWESWLESFEWYEIATLISSRAPELNSTIERFKFNQMKQKEDESFNDFLTRIKLQIANCKYAVMSDELLKDRIVLGIINNEIRERLLSEADLNLEKATQICIACENATNQMKHVLADSDKQVAVTKMNKPEMIQEFVIQSVEYTNLTEDWYEEVKIKGKKPDREIKYGNPKAPVKSFISFSGHRIPVEGQSLAMCMVKNMTAYIRFIISRDNTCPNLGRQTCSNLGLVKRVNTCQTITQEYQEVFEGIGYLKGYEYEERFQTSDMNMQKIMRDLLQDLEGTENSMDDILIHAPDPQTLEIRTRAVLQRLKENGIKLNRDKCKFKLQEVQIIGHIVTTEGIKIDPEKVRAIGGIKSPSNKQELKRLLGMIQYLSKFIPNLAEKTKNMREKTLLRTAPTLKFFNPNENLTLSVDASSYALGAVLLQNGKPIAYASSALNSTQQNYAQTEKEALAIKFGCDKFHQLIYGKLLTSRRTTILQYDLRIKYKKGKELLTADPLSRDCSYEDTYLEENFEVLMTTPTNKSSYEELQALTKEDQELQELKNLILYGWPNYKSAVPESCKKYWPYRDELSTNEDLILKGSRVFIPLKWKAKILKLIHVRHQGINSCLRRARDSIYWHGMSQDIINTVENCRTCQANQRNKTKEHMIIKEIPKSFIREVELKARVGKWDPEVKALLMFEALSPEVRLSLEEMGIRNDSSFKNIASKLNILYPKKARGIRECLRLIEGLKQRVGESPMVFKERFLAIRDKVEYSFDDSLVFEIFLENVLDKYREAIVRSEAKSIDKAVSVMATEDSVEHTVAAL